MVTPLLPTLKDRGGRLPVGVGSSRVEPRTPSLPQQSLRAGGDLLRLDPDLTELACWHRGLATEIKAGRCCRLAGDARHAVLVEQIILVWNQSPQIRPEPGGKDDRIELLLCATSEDD